MLLCGDDDDLKTYKKASEMTCSALLMNIFTLEQSYLKFTQGVLHKLRMSSSFHMLSTCTADVTVHLIIIKETNTQACNVCGA